MPSCIIVLIVGKIVKEDIVFGYVYSVFCFPLDILVILKRGGVWSGSIFYMTGDPGRS